MAWLDGGPRGHGWFAASPVDEIRGASLGTLDEVEAAWRARPDQVWIGWMTYEVGAARWLNAAPRRGRLSPICLRAYARAERVAPGRRPDVLREVPGSGQASTWPLGPLRVEQSPETFRAQVRAAQRMIAAGETYQVNLSQEFTAPWRDRVDGMGAAHLGLAVQRLFENLRRRAPASMGALLHGDDNWIVSNSPETLVSVTLDAGAGGAAIARAAPIKGTRRRGRDAAHDARVVADLLASEKDRAEHVMIVDLVRNDLGRCAVPGSVRAARAPTLVTLPTVHHLVTDVRCELQPGWSLRGLMEALFPGGSITGAPKRRTVEIIHGLEHGQREIYCGAIMVLHPGGLDVSIPIRTGLVDAAGLWLRSGGGIVADSDPESERQETLIKTLAFDPCPREPSFLG